MSVAADQPKSLDGTVSDDRADQVLRDYVEGATPEERAEIARSPLSPRGHPPSPSVPAALVAISRVASLGVFAFYWSRSGYSLEFFFRLVGFLILPLGVAWFPGELARATGRYMAVVVERRSPERWVFALAWVILLVPILLVLTGAV